MDSLVPNGTPSSATNRASSTAYEASRVVWSQPGVLYSVHGYNSLASAQFIHVYDATALPADAAVPIAVLAVAASSSFVLDFGVHGLPCYAGIVLGNSTTGPTKTIGAANCFFTTRFK